MTEHNISQLSTVKCQLSTVNYLMILGDRATFCQRDYHKKLIRFPTHHIATAKMFFSLQPSAFSLQPSAFSLLPSSLFPLPSSLFLLPSSFFLQPFTLFPL
ncbi:MAG: hypothetical protein HC786_15950, partial [Richelia sp. CSU_2_1]|nr:hypothetical protein [Richelia sp. CSU_2_1]